LPTKEEEFKQRFAAVVLDLTTSEDTDMKTLIGGLAGRIISAAGAPNWIAFKARLSESAYSSLLTTFQTQGNALAQQGQHRQVYAIEVLAVSLVAKTQMGDPDIVSGTALLDPLIDQAITAARNAQTADPIID
jgi:hypothetical protein